MSSTETRPTARTVASTQSEMTEIILPNDTNTLGNLLGGRLMHFIDLTGAMAAYSAHALLYCDCGDGHIDFIQPCIWATWSLSVQRQSRFTSSMEVGVKVWAENTQTGVQRHVASAYLVFVAIDKDGRRVKVPELIPETADEKRRYADALLRREHREAEAARRKQARIDTPQESATGDPA